MQEFLTTALSFPTVIYTFFLCLCILLWLLTILGVLSLDTSIDGVDVGDVGDIGAISHPTGGGLTSSHAGADLGADAPTTGQAVGMLSRLGINGVPITIVITLLSLVGWTISFFVQRYFLSSVTVPIIYYIMGLALMFSALIVATIITAQLCKPLRNIFKQNLGIRKKQLTGQTVKVSSLSVDMNYGEALFEKRGVIIHLRIRAPAEENFKYNDRVVLLGYNQDQDYYNVISEADFLNQPSSPVHP